MGRNGRPPSYEPRARKSPPGTWTDERIVAALRDWFDTFGDTPLSYEWSPRSAGLLGLPPGRSDEWMRRHPRWPSTATVIREFGSWARAVRAAELPPARAIAPARGFADRVEAAQRLSRSGYGSAEIAALLGVSPRTVRGYLAARPCRDCGTPVVTAERCRRCAARHSHTADWSREQALRAIREWIRAEGRVPTTGDWTPTADSGRRWAREYPRWPSYVTVRTLFGSWRAALIAAGAEPSRRRWDREAIAAALREFAATNGRIPTQPDLAQRSGLPAPATVRAHFGSLAAAREAAGLSASSARARARPHLVR